MTKSDKYMRASKPITVEFLSPVSGKPLKLESEFCLTDGEGERWPVIEGIPYLRAGSRQRAKEVLRALEGGDTDAALCILLCESDGWWDEPPPSEADLRHLLQERHHLTLRDAMEYLGYGRVGTYFAHRWSDPTYVAGLALLDAHWRAPATAFELACGIGHYIRALDQVGVATLGADIVFSKLWLARNWVVGQRPLLVCFDAEQPWPIDVNVDLALCHDAFYFFRNKSFVATSLGKAALGGTMAVAHVHNTTANNLSGAASINFMDLRALFPGATIYDDAELTRAGSEGRSPVLSKNLDKVEAFSLVTDGFSAWSASSNNLEVSYNLEVSCNPPEPLKANGPLSRPPDGTPLRRNPLCSNGSVLWPSQRYEAEYGSSVTWHCTPNIQDYAIMSPEHEASVARRELLDIPERW